MTQTSLRTMRIGVAGLGFGAAVHVPALQALSNVEVVGVAGRNAERTQVAAKKLGVAHATASVHELLDLGLDAITLALPPDQVAAAARAALSRGVAVLCEKPLGLYKEEALELAQLAHGHVTAMDFIFSELDTFIRLKEIVDSGSLGVVRHAHVLWLTESWAHRSRNWSWKTDATQGGGAGTLFGMHLYFLAEWLFGPASSVIAHASRSNCADFAPIGAHPAEDLIHCATQHESGTSWAATFGNANPGLSVHRWTVVFDLGHVVLENIGRDYTDGFVLNVHPICKAPSQHFESKIKGDGRLIPFGRLAKRFINGVRFVTPVFPDFAAGARVQQFDAAVRASAASGGTQRSIAIFNLALPNKDSND
jgi:predicted dehydrogenase